MENLKPLLNELFDDLLELEDDEFIAKSKKVLNGKSKSLILTSIFLEFPNSNSGSLLTNLGFWFETIGYQDIIKSMLELGKTDLPAYHFARYVPEILGVDLRKAALEVESQHPLEQENLKFFTNLRQLIGPSKHALEKLRDAGASPEKIRESLLNTGAPLLPLPDDLSAISNDD